MKQTITTVAAHARGLYLLQTHSPFYSLRSQVQSDISKWYNSLRLTETNEAMQMNIFHKLLLDWQHIPAR